MSKREVVDLYLTEREKSAASHARVSELSQEVQVRTSLGSDVVEQSIEDMAGDAIGLIDAAAQLSVGEEYAEAVALDNEETAHLKTLAARVAKARAGSALAKAGPEIALGFALVCVTLQKVIAYKLAAKQQRGTR